MTRKYETKISISATLEPSQKRYLDEMATQAGLRGYGEALRELLDLGIAAREAQKVSA